MNTPNKLTVLRIIIVPFFMGFLLAGSTNTVCIVIALLLFAAASVTDAVDGYIARKYNLVTDFGKFVDPLADKMLTTAAYLALMHLGRASCVAVMLILTREFIVSGIRLVAASSGKVIAASVWGKIKTIFQMVSIIAAIILMLPMFSQNAAILVTNILVWLSAAVTVVSGADYVINNFDLIKDAK